ncbi:cmp deaminase [Lecanosticta acicola]|uniref:Cmp deaminase n=1 Tax=Lecanosticta acicola TaxID=111012 RepID=A0AAI8Z0H4_9PEZI|nr:cmp deaminase [Lecanosticta acicola]
MAPHSLFPPRPPQPTPEQIRSGIEACLVVQRRALTMGKRPFSAALIGPDNESVLLTHQSIDHVNHAESSLARLAASHYTQPYLWQCTLYSTWEPCAMCTSTCYWANIGRIVYAASETQLGEITGLGNEENMTMSMPCRKVLEGSQKDVQIIGPVGGLDEVVVRESDVYWKPLREAKEKGQGT